MKQKLQSTFLIAILAIAIFSCKKDDPKPSKTDLLAAKKWTAVKYELNGVDVTSDYLDACNADDYTQFTKNGTTTSYIGTIKCDDTDADETGTWQWKENETIFSVHYTNDDPEDFKLVELTATSLKLSYTDADGTLVITLVGK